MSITSGEVAGDYSGNGIIDGSEKAGDLNADGSYSSFGMGMSYEMAGDLNGSMGITSGEVAGDISGNSIIDGSEKAGDLNADGSFSYYGNGMEKPGDLSGNYIIDNGEAEGDYNGNGIKDTDEVTSVLTTSTTNLSIYPNPSAGVFTIENASELSVLDAYGTEVYRSTLTSSKVDLTHLESGIYLVSLSNTTGTTNHKVIIQK
jgi:hypothetical protein